MRRIAATGLWALGAVALAPATAAAHGFHRAEFASGLLHPWTGWDHAATALAAGWWAGSAGRGPRFAGGIAFLAALATGMALGAAGVQLIGQEAALLGTVLAMGLLLAFGVRPKNANAAAGVLAVVALVHGLAHGAEAPSVAALAGIAAGTALLLGLGAMATDWTRSARRQPRAERS